jgi:hypothetical protein
MAVESSQRLFVASNCADGQISGFNRLLSLWEVVRSCNRAALDAAVTERPFQGIPEQDLGNNCSPPPASASLAYSNFQDLGFFDATVQNGNWLSGNFAA